MKQLRDYQIEKANDALEVLKTYNVVYLSMEVRTGKTVTSFEAAKKFGAKNVLFLTKKKAISSIIKDYSEFGYDNNFKLLIMNDESMLLIKDTFDFVIHDEHHRFGPYPKPNKSAQLFKEKYGTLPMIFLSGTPHPESFSQLYHQFWVKLGFWKNHINFYKWAKVYVDVKKKHLGYAEVNDYSELNQKGKDLINILKNRLFVTYTQKQSGFETSVNKKVLYCEMSQATHQMRETLLKKLFLNMLGSEVIADTAVKLQNKIHQLSSGSIITGDKKTFIIDYSKADFIKKHFEGKKLAMFYFFQAEYDILKNTFEDELTNDLDEFNNSNKHIALQQISGAEGISLAKADVLIFYNFGFSNVKFTQAIDRLTTIDRKENDVYFIFGRGGIEEKIYQRLEQKKDYITSAFKKDYGVQFPKKSN